ncbi:hypothetical protein BDZ91DRAFT_295401 [Kalaharituber pfeilii]|nr:hypothetical protein BDZ91DRAFT_295401 [Kalaharituber pfeilii]
MNLLVDSMSGLLRSSSSGPTFSFLSFLRTSLSALIASTLAFPSAPIFGSYLMVSRQPPLCSL